MYKVIIIKVYVSKCYKKRTTEENDVKFESHVIEEGGKRKVEEKIQFQNLATDGAVSGGRCKLKYLSCARHILVL